MTSTWTEPSGQDHPGSHCLDNDKQGAKPEAIQVAKPDERQGAKPEDIKPEEEIKAQENKRDVLNERDVLETTLSPDATEQPSAVGGDGSVLADLPEVKPPPPISVTADVPNAGAPDHAAGMAAPAAARDFIDVGVSDAEDLRRLEESIRWLMSAGTRPMPNVAPLPPVLGLAPLDGHDDDSLLLDPDTLFSPRPRRHANNVASAAKILLVSAIAAPTAYFVASWLQLPGAAATSDPAVVATPVALSEDQTAASAVLSDAAPSQAVRDVGMAQAPDPVAVPPPVSRVVMATAVPAPEAAAPERLPVVAPPVITAPAPAVQPAKKPARQEIAMLIERGRALFETGDVAAARLCFRRAANAGDAAAAIAMGSTYDPDVLAQRFIRGIEANAEEAQKWYDKAREISQHVEMLAQRP